ncbi:hypothetical protein KAX08_10020 [candidate division WOR-3 bacterium]|nr:hypothetical protein [candidate division WOR-3 bacterium]
MYVPGGKDINLKGGKVMNVKTLLTGILLSLMLLVPMTVKGIEELKGKLEMWNRVIIEREAGEFTERYFALKRGYFRLEPKFNSKIKGRFNIDFFSDEDGLDGAGLKIKYAYLDFSELIPIPESKITAGLIKNYFGTIYDWNYTTIQKALEDKEKICSSTDYGVALYGYLPQGYGEYAVAIMNGEGYKKTDGDVNMNPKFQANLRVIPIPGVTIGGSVFYEDVSFIPDTSMSNLTFAGVTHLVVGPLEAWGEYLYRDQDETCSHGFMVMPVIKLAKVAGADVDLVGRYDYWDKNKDVDNDAHTRITGGFNWNILRDAKNKAVVMLQTNWERTMYEDETKDDKDLFSIQLRWIPGFKFTF